MGTERVRIMCPLHGNETIPLTSVRLIAFTYPGDPSHRLLQYQADCPRSEETAMQEILPSRFRLLESLGVRVTRIQLPVIRLPDGPPLSDDDIINAQIDLMRQDYDVSGEL